MPYFCVFSILENILITLLECDEWASMLKSTAVGMLLKETCFIV